MTDVSKDDIKRQLIAAYNSDATRRLDNASTREDWKLSIRRDFLQILQRENKTSLLEIGAGAGVDARYFQAAGLDVLATDLSPKMVEACRSQGLPARILDVYAIDQLDKKFDAIYSLNVLLHIPKADLAMVLHRIATALKPDGLFCYTVYGGHTKQEVSVDETRVKLPRFFSFLDDTAIRAAAAQDFELVDSRFIDLPSPSSQQNLHVQSLLLRKMP